MRRAIKPWHLILVGIGMNIVASAITHVTIEEKLTELGDIKHQIATLDTQIDSLWQRNIEAERKKEFAALFYASKNIGSEPQPSKLLTNYYESIASNLPENRSKVPNDEAGFVEGFSQYQLGVRDQIDDLYFDRIQLNKSLNPVEQEINFDKNISLFLQLMGLILVLSKDLASHD